MFNILKHLSTQFIMLIAVVNMGYGQTNDTTQKAFNFASDILTHGGYVAYRYNVPDPNEEQMAIMIKMQTSLAMHMDWVKEVLQNLKPGDPMPYHENLGITKDEYSKMLTTFDNVKLIKADSTAIDIIHSKENITFNSLEEFSFVDGIKIDLIKKQIYFNDMELKYNSHILRDKDDSNLPEAWHGFSWLFEEVPVEGLENLDMNKPFDAKLIKLTIGQLVESKSIFLYLTLKIIEDGQYKAKEDLSLILTKK